MQTNRNAPAFRRPRSWARLWEYFEVRFRAEKYGVPYFLAESEAKQSDPRKEAAGARARHAVEDLNGRCLASLRDEEGSRLSRRRYSCCGGRPWVRCISGVSQHYTGVVLGEPGFA